jgi:Cell wall hydrolyses involved in spore germination
MKIKKINPFYFLITLLIIIAVKSDVNAYSININNKEDESRDLFIIDNETAEVFKSFNITNKDIHLMAQVVYGESRGESFDGKVAVASVILNRLISDKFPDSVSEVIYQPNAFSCITDKNIKPDQTSFDAVYKALSGYDPTSNSTFFYNPQISSSDWIYKANKKDVIKIGNHTFFKT